MLGNDGTYASKKRKKPVQKIKPRPENTKTNPSKRHRDRLNGELDSLTSLLPFSEDVRSRLDKLSVLRLSVAYIKVKGFFNATMKNNTPALPAGNGFGTRRVDTTEFSETDLLLQALNGIVLVVTSEGYVFYVSPTIQDYLGFHQSDVLHQSVFELIHTEDRAMFRRQLHFALNPQPFSQDQGGEDMQSSSDITRNIVTYDPQDIPPENSSFLERTFVCRMRCLLDNSSGFLALNFQGRLKFLHGQGAALGNGNSAKPQLALFAVARPVQPPSIIEVRSKMLIFQTKHKLDFTPTGIDSRGKIVLGYSEFELCMRGSGYQFIHAADMMHCADNHVRMMKTGETGMTVFRLLTKDSGWVWVQSNAKLTYKDGRPDFIIARQRVLLNEEGEEHLRQRKLQLPFNFAMGEGVLYENSPSLNISEICDTGKAAKIRKVFEDNELDPDSLLGSFYKQNHSAYMHPDSESQFSIEKVFMETRALMNVPSNSWQHEACHTKDALVAMLETFDQMAADSDLGSALQGMDKDNSELKDWENALLRLGLTTKDGDKSSLDDILTDDILSYLEETLVKASPDCDQALPQNCVRKDNGVQIPKFHMGQKINFGGSCVNGANTLPANLRSAHQGFVALDSAIKDIQIALPESDSIPSLQDLQLDEIFPKLHSCNSLQQNVLATSSSWEKASQVGISSGVGLHSSASVNSFVKSNGCNLSQQNCHSLSNCKMNQISSPQSFPETQCQPHVGMPISSTPPQSFDQSGHVSLDRKRNVAMDQTNPSVFSAPGTNFSTQQMNPRNAFGPNTHDNGTMSNSVSMPFQNPHYQWPQNVAQHVVLNSQNSPPESLLNFVSEKYHSEPTAGVTRSEHSTPSSCMFETCPPPSIPLSQTPHHTAKVVAISSPWKAVNHSQSPPQASCYFQWSPTKPVVGTASIPQGNACISPPACQVTSGTSTSNMILEQFVDCNGQTQIQCHSTEDNESSPIHPLVNGTVYFSETNPTHCYNF